MADVKWIKITTDIFDDEKLLLIESLPEADSIIVIWFKLLCLAGKMNNSGVFLMNEKIAFTDEMLATIFRRKKNTVKMALDTFQNFGMIEIVDNVITIPNWGKHQNLDQLENKREYMREYMQEYRKKQQGIACKTNSKTNCKTNSKTNVSLLDKDIDKDIEKDIEKDKEVEKKKKKNNLATLEDVLVDFKDKAILDSNGELQDIIITWLSYKNERKDYLTNTGIKTLLNKFISMDKSYGVSAVVECVNNSISNNYQGIVWDRINKNIKPTQNSTGNAFLDKWANV